MSEMKREHDQFILSNGKRVFANCYILGIGKDSEGISISGGYDQGIDSDDLTLEEKRELATYAIDLWKVWAEMVLP